MCQRHRVPAGGRRALISQYPGPARPAARNWNRIPTVRVCMTSGDLDRLDEPSAPSMRTIGRRAAPRKPSWSLAHNVRRRVHLLRAEREAAGAAWDRSGPGGDDRAVVHATE